MNKEELYRQVANFELSAIQEVNYKPESPYPVETEQLEYYLHYTKRYSKFAKYDWTILDMYEENGKTFYVYFTTAKTLFKRNLFVLNVFAYGTSLDKVKTIEVKLSLGSMWLSNLSEDSFVANVSHFRKTGNLCFSYNEDLLGTKLSFYIKNSGFRTVFIKDDDVIITNNGFSLNSLHYGLHWNFVSDVEAFAARLVKQLNIKLICSDYGKDCMDVKIRNTFNNKSADLNEIWCRVADWYKEYHYCDIAPKLSLTIEEFLCLAYRKYMFLDGLVINEKYYEDETEKEPFSVRECTWADRQSAMMHFNSLAGDTHWF